MVKQFLLFGMLILFTKCAQEDLVTNNIDCPPPGNIICTKSWITITIPIDLTTLDIKSFSHATSRIVETNNIIHEYTFNKPLDHGPFYATIADDNLVRNIKPTGEMIEYTIFDKEEKVLIKRSFVIGHDCCHVIKIKGPELITL
jgi:hypothetical protein